MRNRLTDGTSNLNHFEAGQRVRGDVSDMAQSALQSGHGNEARLLRGVLRQLDQSLERSSEGFLQANQNFSAATRDIEAAQAGRQAAQRGRSEDPIPAYQELRAQAQAAFRSGYVDPLIAQTEGAALGVNKARPFSNDAFAAEAEAMAPGDNLNAAATWPRNAHVRNAYHALGGYRTATILRTRMRSALTRPWSGMSWQDTMALPFPRARMSSTAICRR